MLNTNTNKYVAIFSKNGFAVFENMKRLNNAKHYLGKSVQKGFEDYYKALNWAEDGYNQEQDDYDNKFFGSNKEVRPDWILFRNKIREKNLEDYT